MAMWALSRLINLWAYPTDTIDFVGIIEEIQLLGAARLLSHLIIGYPQLFVDVVFIPITKSLTCYHPVQCLLKAVMYDNHGPDESMRTIIEYLSPYVYASGGLVMNDLLNMMSTSTKYQIEDSLTEKQMQRETIGPVGHTAKSSTRPCQNTSTNTCADGSTTAAPNADSTADEDLCTEVTEYMFYYIQHHRKIAFDQLISETERRNSVDDIIRISDDIRAELDNRIIWFYPLESLTDKDPGVLYRILMSDRIHW